MDEVPCYQRVVLKLSGEALKGDQPFGLSETVISDISRQLKYIHDLGVDIALVTGGGNIFRGLRDNTLGIDRASADYMGMLATLINGVALRDAIEHEGLHAHLMSALEIKAIAEPFSRRRAMQILEEKKVLIFAAGTGNPFFTTDTAAALRAVEIKANILLKGTMVDGVYSHDPKKVANPERFERISFSEVLSRELKVMDSTAFTLCRENQLPIKIFDITQKNTIIKAVTEEHFGTTVY